jgi:hypothetical protein
MKVNPRIKRILRFSFSALYLSGATYFIFHKFLRVHGEFGDSPSLIERFVGPIHFIFAVTFIFVFGMVWNYHIEPAIRIHRHRFSGWSFVVLLSLLASTATVILYGNETWIGRAEFIHPYIGLLLLPNLFLHWNPKVIKKLKNAISRA